MGKNVIISTLPNISQNYLPKVNTSNIFANSLVYDNGTNVMVNTTTANTDYTGARLVVSNTSNSYLEVRSTAGQSSIVLTTATSTTSNFPTVEIFNSADFGIVAYRPGVLSSNYLMYYELSSSTNRRLTFQTEGVTRLGIQGAGRILMGPTLPTDDGSTALQVNGGGKFSSSVTAVGVTSTGNIQTSASNVVLGLGNTANNESVVFSYNSNASSRSWRILKDWTAFGDFQIQQSTTQTGSSYDPKFVINPSGNVGIGTSSPTWLLELYKDSSSGSTGQYPAISVNNPNAAGYSGYYFYSGSTQKGGIEYSNSANSFSIYCNNASPRMTITSGGNVLIGGTVVQNSSANRGNLTINGTTSILNLSTSDTNAGYLYHNGTDMLLVNAKNGATLFYTQDTERMRITSGGEVGIGVTPTAGNKFWIRGTSTSSSDTSLFIQNSTPSSLFLVRNDGLVGFPKINDFTTGNSPNTWINPSSSYGIYINTSSIRYKKDIANYDKGLDIVNQLRPVYYKGKSEVDGDKQFAGFIAEEIDELGLTEFVNYLEDGRPNSLSYPNMVVLLTKAIQELKAELDTLKTK